MPIWDDVIPEDDVKVYEAAGWGRDAGYGQRPVVVVVDVIYNFVGDKPEPILDSIKRWRYSCGERGWEGVGHLAQLLEVARAQQVPIFYTGMNRRPDGFDQGIWNAKSTRSAEAVDVKGAFGNEIVAEVAPRPEDVYFVKDKPSAFMGSPLLAYLVHLGADTIITTGTTTSGCVRATAVDAAQYNFHSIVPEECVWDRGELTHKVNLFDIQMKYGDVRPTADVINYLQGLPVRPCGPNTPTGVAPDAPSGSTQPQEATS